MPPPARLADGGADRIQRRAAQRKDGFRRAGPQAYFDARSIPTCWRLFMSRRFRTVPVRTASLSLSALAALLFIPAPVAAQQDSTDTSSGAWDVSRSYGPTRTIRFETGEATWVNVTVSPDGSTIVFDVLGDLYAMPITGGTARRITSGPAYDMQPRYSPDGRTIAYISDAGGAHNVWLMDADFTNQRQLTKERQRLVNSPAWSPDGQYIYVRKHFVQQRSLGAGEVWMYHVSGGDGLQVTERNGWQKDAGEPAISPDGRYLYYSKDVTPGQTFEYNKDPYGVIYAIIRRDLRTGEETRYVDRPGGSITPLPSPDGRRDGTRVTGLQPTRSRHAGGVGDPRCLPAVRVAARQPHDRDLGRGQDLAGRHGDAAVRRDPVPRSGRAGRSRAATLPGRGRARSLPGAHAARRHHATRRPLHRVLCPRPHLREADAEWRAAPTHPRR